MRALVAQFSAFVGVGFVAAAVHYSVLIGLVELGGMEPVPATLAGFVAGGVVSYVLNRRHTYRSERSHAAATWRFTIVAAIGFGLTAALMWIFVERLDAPYLPAQVVTTGIVMMWNFVAHKFFSFGERAWPFKSP